MPAASAPAPTVGWPGCAPTLGGVRLAGLVVSANRRFPRLSRLGMVPGPALSQTPARGAAPAEAPGVGRRIRPSDGDTRGFHALSANPPMPVSANMATAICFFTGPSFSAENVIEAHLFTRPRPWDRTIRAEEVSAGEGRDNLRCEKGNPGSVAIRRRAGADSARTRRETGGVPDCEQESYDRDVIRIRGCPGRSGGGPGRCGEGRGPRRPWSGSRCSGPARRE